MVSHFSSVFHAAWLIPMFPLAGFLMLIFFGKRWKEASGAVATIMMLASFVYGLVTFASLIQVPQSTVLGARTYTQHLFTWITGGSFRASVDYRIDPLSIVMILVVTGVGTLITLYSNGYMRGDPRVGRFFAYINLFAFSMLVLVMANNFLLMFVGWELVGLCSYLLIGFWFEDRANATAAKKAFITTRVGDTAFLIGLFVIFSNFHSLDFSTVLTQNSMAVGTATVVAFLLFGGAIGKSAQIPLFVWLPDAMAGPTPVSALIHAATMVTAGVYLVARAHVFYDISHVAAHFVAWIGVATMLLAGIIAIAQDDIKKVLAYSTISQLGYMFIAVGTGAYAAGIFHLVTHAFFKALLFLGAGSVMHAMANRTDITKMGGLFKKIPWTGVTFAAGWLAIIGFPGTSGFFSKDQILEGAFKSHQYAVWALGVLGVFITGFYMTRMFSLVFLGSSRDPEDHHPHESPLSMVFPLAMLGIASIAGGFILGPTAETGRIQRFLESSVRSVEFAPNPLHSSLTSAELSGIALVIGLLGALVALIMYRGGRWNWQARREHPSTSYRVVRNKFYVDEAYQFVFTGVGKVAAASLAFVVDARWIDGVVNGVGTVTTRVAAVGRKVQSGLVRTYALGVLGGAVLLIAFLVVRAK
ncbi:MAG: NADH-quinone oxidoreductase subunit L [Actinomycetota bacterium]